ADYFIENLPGLAKDANVKAHSGHITINETANANIFFWLIHNRHIADKSKFIIWLNGGPWRINTDNETLRLIDGSWNEYANVLYVDQPIGTGFSYANSNSYLTNVTQ
ncbi:5365_t:CDS:2, partial [Dentiscutata erythropus]